MLKESYNKLLYVKDHGYLPFVMRFTKTTIFFIIVECLISIYFLELFTVLTSFFVVNPTNIPALLLIIIIPLILGLCSAVLFGIICPLHFLSTVYTFSTMIEKKEEGFRNYNELIKQYRKHVDKFHSIGIALYFLIPLIITNVLINLFPKYFSDANKFRIFIPLVSFILGVIWNLTGYFRNQRILWHKLIPKQQLNITENEKKDIIKRNVYYLIYNIIGNIASILFLIVMTIIIIKNLHNDIISSITTIFTEYNFLLATFLGLCAFYLKYTVSLIYSSKDKKDVIFPSLRQIFYQ